jgi:hypothetical protein
VPFDDLPSNKPSVIPVFIAGSGTFAQALPNNRPSKAPAVVAGGSTLATGLPTNRLAKIPAVVAGGAALKQALPNNRPSRTPAFFGGSVSVVHPGPAGFPVIGGGGGGGGSGDFNGPNLRTPAFFGASVSITMRNVDNSILIDYPYDPVNRLADPATRELDDTELEDTEQLLGNQKYFSYLFPSDHDPNTGAHVGKKVSDLNNYSTILADQNVVLLESGSLGVGPTLSTSLLVYPFFTVKPNPGVGIYQSVPLYGIGFGVVSAGQYALRLSGAQGNAKVSLSVWGGDSDVPVAANLVHGPDTYDASGVGKGFTKNHYTQGLEGTTKLVDAFRRKHAIYTNYGKSIISPTATSSGLKGSFKTFKYQTTPTSRAIIDLGAHSGQHKVVLPSITYPDTAIVGGIGTFFVTTRVAYDDTNAYMVIDFIQSAFEPNEPNYIKYCNINAALLDPYAGANPSLPALDLVNPALQGYSTGEDFYNQIRSNNLRLKGLFEREHDPKTGEHRVPLERLDGFTEVYNNTINAPDQVGDLPTIIAIDTNTTGKWWFNPTLVGSAGSGKAIVSLAFDNSNVYAVVHRLTAGDVNTFTMKAYRVNNA